jgi:hypothetical protein
MASRWLSWLNCFLLGLVILLGAGSAWLWMQRPKEIACEGPLSKRCGLPKGAFTLPAVAYHGIGEPLLALQISPPTIQLPDLRQHLIYYGKNGRPDAQSNHTLLHFSLSGNKTVTSIPPGEKLYLVYDKQTTPHRYVFSSHNAETSLWIEGSPEENEAVVKVFMKNDKGEIITEPESHAQIRLPEKEFIRYAGTTWEIGSWRVDGTLLARQKARWFGSDRFLERHGGDDYKEMASKQRIDFGENDDLYSVFIGVGDCLIWDGNCWKSVMPGKDSLSHPLLVVKKIDERLMTLELWDVEGKGKITLNMLKSTEPWMMQNAQTIQQTFKFVGARTRTQCVFEVNHERVLMSPNDWFLYTNKGWKKLASEEELDHYVKRKTTGVLFVFEGLTRKEDRQIMKGVLYNPSRSDFQVIELPIQQIGSIKPAANKEAEKGKEEANSIPIKMDMKNLEAPRPVMETPPVPTVKESLNNTNTNVNPSMHR